MLKRGKRELLSYAGSIVDFFCEKKNCPRTHRV